jgi:spore coat protein U-like protein
MRRGLLPAFFALAAALASAGVASAQPRKVDCGVFAQGVSFGTYTGGLRDATGLITVTCFGNGATQFSVFLSTGESSRYAAREMSSGGNRLLYNLYSDPAHRNVWGDGTGGSEPVHGLIQLKGNPSASESLSIYGQIPQQTPMPGAYSDRITVTLNF